MKRLLSFGDVQQVVAGVPGLRGIVLVGGQALNYWSERFDLKDFGLALSADIDFLGSGAEATEFARSTGGRAEVATLANAHSPNTALVYLKIDGDEYLIDFLGSLKGFSPPELEQVRKWAVPVEVVRGTAHLSVMHPVHCLQSALENVYGTALDRRSGPGGARYVTRVRLTIEACRRITLEYLEQARQRDALRIAEKVHELSILSTAMRARAEDGVEVSGAIPVNGMPEAFVSKRAPQLQRERDIATRKYQRLLERRAAVAKKKKR